MATVPFLSRLAAWKQAGQWQLQRLVRRDLSLQRPNLHHLARNPGQLPLFVRECAVAQRYLHLLGALAWDSFPERDLERHYGIPAIPYAPFAAACLVKLDQQLRYMSTLRQYLIDHPALTWVLGFPLQPSKQTTWGFDVASSLPTHRHFTRMLRQMPNAALQYLLDSSVACLQAALPADAPFGRAISLDTKHVVAWVKENNPKAYVGDRFDKRQQPTGDPDCRLGCKRRRNRSPQEEPASLPTPTKEGKAASTIGVGIGEYYWGYASGVVATKVPQWGEFVLAEWTQPFDQPDVSYFFPLMAATERRLGFRPKYGAFDTAFDAFYVYEHFHAGDGSEGFAAVPFCQRGGHKKEFDENGLPLCPAGLAMPLKYTFWSKTTLVHHHRGRHVCPLSFPEETGNACPIAHKRWAKGGCTTTIPVSIGARIRYQLDRDSEAYKQVYKQRTATERINAQAVELGIERPKIRNGQAIANQNTLTYVLINLRGLQRVRRRRAQQT